MRLCPRIKVCGVALVMRMRILSVLARQRQALCLSQTHYCRYERLDDVIGIIIDGILPTLILNQVNYDECKANVQQIQAFYHTRGGLMKYAKTQVAKHTNTPLCKMHSLCL